MDNSLSPLNKILLSLMRLFGKFTRKLGIDNAYKVASFFATLVWHLFQKRQKLAKDNIQKYLNVTAQEAHDIALQSFKENFCSFADALLTQNFGFHEEGKRLIIASPEKLHNFRTTLRPIVGITGHFGSWEFLANLLGEMCTPDRPRIVVARKYSNPAVQTFLTEQRSFTGTQILGHRAVVPTILKALRKNGMVAFLADHRPKKNEAINVNFLGQETAVNMGPALLGVRTEALIWPMFLNREKNGTFTCHIYDALDTKDLEGTQEEKIRISVEFYTKVFEEHIKKYPEQWFWMHDRWKPPV